MTAISPEASRQAAVAAALLVLERMGLSPADLAAVPQPRQPVPTFAEYVPIVSAAVSAGRRLLSSQVAFSARQPEAGTRVPCPHPLTVASRAASTGRARDAIERALDDHRGSR